MRFSLVVLAAVSLASAGSVFKRHNDFQVPWCAKDCVANGDPSPCKPGDTACICLNEDYGKQVAECVTKCCSPEDAKAAAEVGIQYCKDAGVYPIPDCSVECVQEAPNFNCDQTDVKCFCENKDFIQRVQQCFNEKCQGEDLNTAVRAGKAQCRAVGVDISPFIDW